MQQSSQKLLSKKMVMAYMMHVISRKILMMKSKEWKCYMYLNFHINPPYIVEDINFIRDFQTDQTFHQFNDLHNEFDLY